MGESVDKYFDPKEPGSYAGASTYHRHHPQMKLEKLAEILSAYRGFTLHKPVRRRFPRNKTIVGGIDAQWDIDLSDMTKFADDNDNMKFLLCVIDVFSKKAWILPMKNKTPAEIIRAFEKLFTLTARRPRTIRSDKGGEFKNKAFDKFVKKHKIKYFITQNEETKAAVVERFQRTIKGKMWRYFKHNRTTRYIDVLDDLVSSYNNTYHRSIGMPPNDVKKEMEATIFRRLYKKPRLTKVKYKFKVGDYVRIISTRMIFRKAYEGDWTEEIFKVVKQILRDPPVYRVVDLNDELIEGTFYAFELQKVKFNEDIFIVEEIIKQRKRNGKTQYYVKWLGYPKTFNSWVDNFVE